VTHVFLFTLAAPSWGETEVEGEFCCEHFDSVVVGGRVPIIDLAVKGVVRV
jgi:hypothetical protein